MKPIASERVCVVIPAFDASVTIASVVRAARAFAAQVVVVDDGSVDDTAVKARSEGAMIIAHPVNRGKGGAIRTGLMQAHALGYPVVITLDADGQHPPHQIPTLLEASQDESALVIGVRDLVAAGAPIGNQRSNAFANWFLSIVTSERLRDTQCGMRRYPVAATLALGVKDDGFAFETEVILRALRASIPIVQIPIDVVYPKDRTTHFDARRDPWRIVLRVLRTLILDRR
ncbi:MAG: hypothetical protein NVSMB1_11480 [Polyangiales bacterium]